MPVLSTRIVLDCFYLLIFYSEKFSTDDCRLPYAVNVNLNLSNHTVQNNGDQRAMSGRNGYLTGQRLSRTNSRILTRKS